MHMVLQYQHRRWMRTESWCQKAKPRRGHMGETRIRENEEESSEKWNEMK